MKKLMIAVAVACVAALSQAASWSWVSNTQSTKGIVYDGSGDAVTAYTTFSNGGKVPVTLYLFAASEYTQQQAFNDIMGTTGLNKSKAVSQQNLNSSSKVSSTTFTWGTDEGDEKTWSFYAVSLFDDDTFYISDTASKAQLHTGTAALTFTFNTSSKNGLDAGEGWKGAGVYSTVPEPTSGLLLLLGVAGLALRRRRV